jgi:glycosyltransferase involved in cell wall biosynthesis
MIKKINYSIIIPHYNAPLLLNRCIESISKRNDIEIIIIDDNSDSNIVDFDNFPGVDRNDVDLVFLKERKGAGYARNVGLSKAKGQWLLFCDADDFYLDGFLSVINKYLYSDADIVFFNITSVYSDSLEVAYRHKGVDNLIKRAASRKIYDMKKLKYSFLEPFSKLYKREYIERNHITFEEVFFSNDTMFTLTAALKTNNIIVDQKSIYCVTVTKNSLTNLISEQILDTRLEVAVRANNLLKFYGEKRYQKSVIPFIILSSKISLLSILKTIIFLTKNKQNIFSGCFVFFKIFFLRFTPSYRYHSKMSNKYKSNV